MEVGGPRRWKRDMVDGSEFVRSIEGSSRSHEFTYTKPQGRKSTEPLVWCGRRHRLVARKKLYGVFRTSRHDILEDNVKGSSRHNVDVFVKILIKNCIYWNILYPGASDLFHEV